MSNRQWPVAMDAQSEMKKRTLTVGRDHTILTGDNTEAASRLTVPVVVRSI